MTSLKIKLRGMTWTARFVTQKELKEADKDMPELMGLTVYETVTIYVRNDMHPDQIRATFWHELTHAILSPLNGCSTDNQTSSVDVETVCNLMGEAMLEIAPQMKNWPAIILPKWMLKLPEKKKAKE